MDVTAWLANMGGGDSGPAAGSGTKEPGPDDAAGSHFPHISAANALAAAVSSGDAGAKSARSKLHGKFLEPHSVVDLDEPRSCTQPQLQVSPITVVKTEYRLQMLHLIAVNSTYICYGLKQGSIRALNKNTAGRVLLKDHSSMVTDMQFFASGSNLLASCDQDGDVVIRKIFEDGEGEGEEAPSIQHEVLSRHALGPSPAATRRLAWHPQLESLLAVVAGDRIALVNVPPTSGIAASPEFASPALPAADGAMTEGAITTLAFCDAGNMLAAADACGFVYVWALDAEVVERWAAGGAPLEPLPAEPDVKFRAFDDGQFVAAMDFLPSRPAEQGQEPQQAALLVGDSTCRVLKLWSIDVEAKPTCTSSLELTSSNSGPTYFYNHMLLQPNFNAVLLANCRNREVYVVHVKQHSSGAAHFDHWADFAVNYPILSMSTTTEPCYEDGAEVFQLFTVQTEFIQQYTLFPEVCLPPADGADEAAAQHDELHEPTPQQPTQQREAWEGGSQAGAPAAPHVAQAAPPAPAPEAALPVQLLSPADVLNSGWGSGSLEMSRSVPDGLAPSPVAADTGSALQPIADGDSPPAPAPAPDAPVQSSSAPPPAAGAAPSPAWQEEKAAVAPAAAGEPAAAGPMGLQQQRQHPMPPQPTTLLVKKLAAARGPAAASQEGAAGALASPEESVDGGSKAGSVAAATAAGGSPAAADDAAATAVAAAMASTAAAAAAPTAGVGEQELARVIALQQQLLSQLAASQRETLKQLRAEMAKHAKASEAATAKTVDAALKAYAKQAEAERAREAKREREEVVRALQAASAGVVKDVASRVQDASRATVATLTNTLAAAVGTALAEALPPALAAGSTEQALERALGGQLRGALPRAVADSFASSVIPAYERATAAMFGQIQTAFAAGMAEQAGAARDGLAELKDATAAVQGAVAQLGAAAAAAAAVPAGAAGAGPGAAAALDRSRSGAISLAALEAQRDPKHLISSQLALRNYQAAFMHALSTGNAETTMWLCKQLSPSAVFDVEPCPLSQEVLLSLVTHLAYQLQAVDTDVKLAWLVEATPAIDPRHPKLVEHCKQVLEPIKAQLAVLARSLTGDSGKLAKTAVHLVNSLLHQ